MLIWLVWHGPSGFASLQVILSLVAGGVMVFGGLVMLLLWVPGYEDLSSGMKQNAKDHIRDAYFMLAVAVLCAAFGLFFEAPLLIVIFVWMIHTIFKSIKIVRS